MEMNFVLILVCYFNSIKTDSINTDLPESMEKYKELFKYYKSKYGKRYYTDSDEKNAFLNFIDNSKKVEDINLRNKNSTYYVIDRYADIDPEYMDEHFAVTVNPIASEPLRNIKADIAKEKTRTKQEKVLEETKLFDLEDAEELYERYLKDYGKTTPKNKYQRQQNYLRFVKSMVAVNRNHVNGDGNASLEDDADEVKQPKEYSY